MFSFLVFVLLILGMLYFPTFVIFLIVLDLKNHQLEHFKNELERFRIINQSDFVNWRKL